MRHIALIHPVLYPCIQDDSGHDERRPGHQTYRKHTHHGTFAVGGNRYATFFKGGIVFLRLPECFRSNSCWLSMMRIARPNSCRINRNSSKIGFTFGTSTGTGLRSVG